jgi:lysophospholipase L1-like esterase
MSYLRELQMFGQQNQIVSGVGYRLKVTPHGTTQLIDFPAGGGSGGITEQRMIVMEVEWDWFLCLKYDEDGQHPPIGEATPADYIKVAKAWELRVTDWDGQTIDGITFDYDVGDLMGARRTATQGAITEEHIVVRPWYVGEIILAVSKVKGGTDATDDGPAGDGIDPESITWEDTNQASHAWALEDDSDASITTHALGDLLFGDAIGGMATLAGNATAIKKYLRQTGTGTLSAAPAWDALVESDVSNLVSHLSNKADLAAANYWPSKQTFGATADFNAAVQIKGALAAPDGSGSLEIEYNNPTSYITSYNRAGAVWKPLVIRGSDLTFQNSGATALSLIGGNMTVGATAALGDLSQAGAVAMCAFGDSITAGNAASTTALRYTNLICAGKNYTLTNVGVSGSQLADTGQIDLIYATASWYDQTYTLLSGVNDMRTRGTNAALLQNYEDALMAALAWLAIPSNRRTLGSAGSAVGTWSATTRYAITTGKKSSTTGDTLSFTARGSVVYVGATRLTTAGGAFTVSVDGTVFGPYLCSGGDTTAWGKVYSPFLVRIANLPDIDHLVVVTLTSSAEVQIDWCGANGGISLRTGPNVFCGNCCRLNSTGYASGAPYDQGSDTAVYGINRRILAVCKRLAADGLNVVAVDSSAFYDVTTDISADGIHPNDTGMAHIASAFLQAMNQMQYPRERQGSQWHRGYTPSFCLGEYPNLFRFDTANHRFGLGASDPAFLCDLRGNALGIATAQLHFSSDSTLGGFYVITDTINRSFLCTGANYVADWTARSTAATLIKTDGATTTLYANTGLTSGNTYTPTAIVQINTAGLGISGGLNIGSLTPPAGGFLAMSGRADISGGIQVLGAIASPAGAGSVEIEYNGATSYFTSYDRTGSLWKPIIIRGGNITLQNSGATALTLIAGVLNVPGLTASQVVKTDASKNLVSYDLDTVLALKAPLASPSFTGTVNMAGLTASLFVKTDASKNLVSFDLFGTANTWSLKQTLSAVADFSAGIQIKGALAAPDGSGSLELEYNSPTSYITSYNRSGGVWKPIIMRGGDITFQNSGAAALTLIAGVVNIAGLTASQFVKTDASKNLVSTLIAQSDVTNLVADLAAKGTVTSFSAGDFSPLFTTAEATATTTPALTFTAITQAQNLIFGGPASGSAAAPTFRALVALDIPTLDITKITTSITSGRILYSDGSAIASSANLSFASGHLSLNTNDVLAGATGSTTLDCSLAAGANYTTSIAANNQIGVQVASISGVRQIGFFGIGPVARAGAFTQTYATASHTITQTTMTDPATYGAGANGYSTAAMASAIHAEVLALKANMVVTQNVLNGVIDDLQSYGLLA